MIRHTGKTIILFAALLALLGLTLALSLALGGTTVPFPQLVNALLHPHGIDTASVIVWQLRLPRILLGMLVGAGLAASGCVFQGMLKNPLADPYTLGISGGAALGATIGIVLGLASISVALLPVCAFLGTLACLYLVYLAAARSGFATHSLILAGVILGFMFASLVLLIFALSSADKVHAAITWLMGDLS
jgi:iron complex transport system permease protein